MTFNIKHLGLLLFVHLALLGTACTNKQPLLPGNDKTFTHDPQGTISLTPSLLTSLTLSHQNCVNLANKIKTLYIGPENIISPKDIAPPDNSKILDIYEIVEDVNNKALSSVTDGKILICKGKAKISKGNYPITFYLIIENKLQYIILESEGKRKWVFKW